MSGGPGSVIRVAHGAQWRETEGNSHEGLVPGTSTTRSFSSRQLDLIVAVSRSESLRGAAAKIGLSQSGLTRQLQQMESRLGAKLLHRNHAGVRLTDAGERLLTLARIVQRLEADLLVEVGTGTAAIRGNVRICGFSSVMRSVVLPSLSPLLRRHDALSVECMVEELYLVASRGASSDADLLVTQAPLRLAGYTAIEIGHEYNVLIESEMDGATHDVLIDHEPNDRFSEHYLCVTGLPLPTPLRRRFCDDIYGLIDAVAHGIGRAVVPIHLLSAGQGCRVATESIPMRVPVVLNVHSHLLAFSAVRAVVDAIVAGAPSLLSRNALDIDLRQAVDGAFVGPSHKFSE